MQLSKKVTEFLSVVCDIAISLLTAFGRQLAQFVWVVRIALYGLQAFFIVTDYGRGKATNLHSFDIFHPLLRSAALLFLPARIPVLSLRKLPYP
jgi:hypothetical protein